MKKVIDVAFNMGETVYHKCDREGHEGVITGILILPTDSIMYSVSWGDTRETRHWACELSNQKWEEFANESTNNNLL